MSMSRLTPILAFAALALAACNTYDTPRPFAGRGGRSLDQPPRYGDPNRYVEPIAPPPGGVIDPNGPVVGPNGSMTAPGTPGLDQGLAVVPPGTVPATPPPPGGIATPPVSGSVPPVPGVGAPPPAVTPPVPGDVPFARGVPGKPGYVYSPKDPTKVISVEGLRPGSKAKDPDTGEIFRVPFN